MTPVERSHSLPVANVDRPAPLDRKLGRMTERLYYTDSRLLRFGARVIAVECAGDRPALVLDRSAFYPTGGGQPHDTGTIAGLRVVDVIAPDEAATVLHVVEDLPRAKALLGADVEGSVDPVRRRDHMQQHTGQHILSQAFVQAGGYETRSFHLGAESSSIDLATSSLPESALVQAEELANQVVFDDREVRVHQVKGDEVSRFPIRRQTFSGECVRIIEVEDFDFSTCGGTHARHTGEIGLIAILGTERVKQMTRVEFVCGGRALRALRSANHLEKKLCRQLSTGASAVAAKVSLLLLTGKTQQKRIQKLFEQVVVTEAARLLESAQVVGSSRVLCRVLSETSLDEARLLAQKACEKGCVIVLLAALDDAEPRLLFARSNDVVLQSLSMGDLMKQVTLRFSGKGGGSPLLAQGGIARPEDLQPALQMAVAEARRLLPG